VLDELLRSLKRGAYSTEPHILVNDFFEVSDLFFEANKSAKSHQQNQVLI
jgi:hypothetical protein